MKEVFETCFIKGNLKRYILFLCLYQYIFIYLKQWQTGTVGIKKLLLLLVFTSTWHPAHTNDVKPSCVLASTKSNGRLRQKLNLLSNKIKFYRIKKYLAELLRLKSLLITPLKKPSSFCYTPRTRLLLVFKEL